MTTIEANTLNNAAARAFADKLKSHARELGVSRVVLFGSTARGTATEDSDVDVLVLLKDVRMKEDWGKISPSFSEICGLSADVNERFDYNVSVSPVIYGEGDYSDIRSLLLRHEIERDGVTLYADR